MKRVSGKGVDIKVENVIHEYGDNRVLDGVNMEVAAGATLCVLGGSGTGKSVLVRLMAGLEVPTSGAISIGGLLVPEYAALPPDDKPFLVSMVFQHSALLGSLTVEENVTLRMREHRTHSEKDMHSICEQVLDEVEMGGSNNKLPGELSGGMKKRVALARALAVNPDLLFYDEPTAELDPVLTEQIGLLIARVRRDRPITQVVVTHDLVIADIVADRVAMLEGGRIAEEGSYREFRASADPGTRSFLKAARVLASRDQADNKDETGKDG
ncbi:MAG TPA: ATP-binding cassette domain-containing protein [Deltaproteobacteria bacterium]|nr:ATP-binding cassette domain-containing protein [Candidatus Binatota bacterium]HIL12196.1 ATP-binding cassette domain-containing protein [Deltaproteobacteria bacterium]